MYYFINNSKYVYQKMAFNPWALSFKRPLYKAIANLESMHAKTPQQMKSAYWITVTPSPTFFLVQFPPLHLQATHSSPVYCCCK